MQAAANQVRWVPIGEIVEPWEASAEGAPAGAVVLSQRPDGRYTLVGGLNTLRRMRDAGQLCVDAVTCPAESLERRVARLLDQLMRGRLHYLDEAEEYRALLAAGMEPRELAARIGRTPATIRKKLRLLNLGDEATALLRERGLCEGYAQALLRVPGIQGRLRVLRHVIEEGLTVPDTERLVSDVLSRMPVPLAGGRHMKPLIRDYRLYVNAIRGVVEQMRDAGMDARMQVSVGQRVAEVRIDVPRQTAARLGRK